MPLHILPGVAGTALVGYVSAGVPLLCHLQVDPCCGSPRAGKRVAGLLREEEVGRNAEKDVPAELRAETSKKEEWIDERQAEPAPDLDDSIEGHGTSFLATADVHVAQTAARVVTPPRGPRRSDLPLQHAPVLFLSVDGVLHPLSRAGLPARANMAKLMARADGAVDDAEDMAATEVEVGGTWVCESSLATQAMPI